MSHLPAPLPQARLVVLGASNVVRGLGPLLAVAEQEIGTPLEFMAAIGHGRSYNLLTTVVGRQLSGILHCGLWKDLTERSDLPTTALVTDVGNDILYAATPEQITTWVEACLERLAPICERIILTQLPLSSVSKVGPRKFWWFRRLLFPQSTITLESAQLRALETNARLCELAARFGAVCHEPSASWYGFDPIHIRTRQYVEAWRAILAPPRDGESKVPRARTSLFRSLRMQTLAPQTRTVFGVEQRTPQPVLRLASGTTISLY